MIDAATTQRIRRVLAERPDKPLGIVLDVGFTNGLASARALRDAGAPVIVVDHRKGAFKLARSDGQRTMRRLHHGYISRHKTIPAAHTQQ